MEKQLLIFILLLSTAAFAQKSINGRLILGKADDKAFVLRNTKVMLVSGTKTDSTAIADDLTFTFNDIPADTAMIYLKSPLLSPKAVTKLHLRKRKPTKLRLDYDAIHNFSTRAEPGEPDEDDFAKFSAAMQLLQTVVVLFMALHK
ncbi:MAG: hypothetical protein EOO48_02140 [Flavobacterium sp.]|nr:MAG: hypothetical protein EOO48_02140 [Flavobacterium sp.]